MSSAAGRSWLLLLLDPLGTRGGYTSCAHLLPTSPAQCVPPCPKGPTAYAGRRPQPLTVALPPSLTPRALGTGWHNRGQQALMAVLWLCQLTGRGGPVKTQPLRVTGGCKKDFEKISGQDQEQLGRAGPLCGPPWQIYTYRSAERTRPRKPWCRWRRQGGRVGLESRGDTTAWLYALRTGLTL